MEVIEVEDGGTDAAATDEFTERQKALLKELLGKFSAVQVEFFQIFPRVVSSRHTIWENNSDQFPPAGNSPQMVVKRIRESPLKSGLTDSGFSARQ